MSELFGYSGKFLRVDMTSRRIIEERMNEAVLRKYLGGAGIGVKILYDEVPLGVEWSDPLNRLILAAGPLNGTVINGSGSLAIVTKGAITNGLASTQANGFFGAYLKFCGVDGIIVQGASDRPLYLYIDDVNFELREAGHLAGRDTYEVEEELRRELGKKGREVSIASIGPAGENLVRFAGIFSDTGHTAPHNGVGAVMGSKKLKAIAVLRGRKRVAVKNPEELRDISRKLLEDVKNLTKKIYDWGTLWANIEAYKDNWLPVRNYTTSVWQIEKEKIERFSPEYIRSHYVSKFHPCWACQVTGHVHMMKIPSGRYSGLVTEEPEYEQFAAWGPLIDNRDVDGAIMLSNWVDRLGMDTNEAGWIISFVMECYEKGILTKKEIEGLEMTWGNVEATKALLTKIAKREGFGNILAEGVMRAAQRIGREAPNIAVYTRKGNTPRGHDHRTRRWEMFDTAVSNTGTLENTLPGLGATPDRWEEIATTEAKTKGAMVFEDSMVTCRFNTRSNLELLSRAVSAVTGWDFTYEEAANAGRRIVNLMKVFNVRHGLADPKLDQPSSRYGSTPTDGPWKGQGMLPNWDKMVRRYYNEMGWDEETGKPLPETLRRLGLEEVVKDIWR